MDFESQNHKFFPIALLWIYVGQQNSLHFHMIHNQFLTILHQMTPFLDNISSKFSSLFLFLEIWTKFVVILTVLPPFLVFSQNDPFFLRKNLSPNDP